MPLVEKARFPIVEDVIQEELVEIILFWNHNSGFNVPLGGSRISGTNEPRIEQVSRYMSRATISEKRVENYIQLSSQFYYPYLLTGHYYSLKGQKNEPWITLKKGLSKEIPRLVDWELIREELDKLEES